MGRRGFADFGFCQVFEVTGDLDALILVFIAGQHQVEAGAVEHPEAHEYAKVEDAFAHLLRYKQLQLFSLPSGEPENDGLGTYSRSEDKKDRVRIK